MFRRCGASNSASQKFRRDTVPLLKGRMAQKSNQNCKVRLSEPCFSSNTQTNPCQEFKGVRVHALRDRLNGAALSTHILSTNISISQNGVFQSAVQFRRCCPCGSALIGGVFKRPLTLIRLQKYRDTNGNRIVIQIGFVYTTFCQAKGILLQTYRNRNGRCLVILFKSIGVRGQCGSPD